MEAQFRGKISSGPGATEVLLVCICNSGRSQMAEAYFNHYAAGKAWALSAGTQSAEDIDPTVMQVIAEVGLDMSSQHPKLLTTEMMDRAGRVVAMGCGIEGGCPAALVPVEGWEMEDLAGQPIEKVRQIRDEIETRVKRMVEEMLYVGGEGDAQSGHSALQQKRGILRMQVDVTMGHLEVDWWRPARFLGGNCDYYRMCRRARQAGCKARHATNHSVSPRQAEARMMTTRGAGGEQALNGTLQQLRNQLARYQRMAKEEREKTGGETYGTCAYLEGAIVASRHALEIVESAGRGTEETDSDRPRASAGINRSRY